MATSHALHELTKEVDDWVDKVLPNNYPSIALSRIKSNKVIREAVSGYQVLEPHEYIIIDSPILQRLRYIHQTSLAYLVYPTANHTRFDHSLGVAKIASEIGRHLDIEKNKLIELRLAALLHDVGQCLFSHLSETLMEYKFSKLYKDAKVSPEFEGKDLPLSEILSYLIIKSPKFNDLLKKVVWHYHAHVDIDIIAKLVIGKVSNDFAYLSDIISGPFDADKCDYLVRDCYFCGIRADIDVPRVLISSLILDRTRFKESDYPRRNLVMRRAGAPNLEQIIFNKMLLFPAVYHHHKVRALECMVRAIFEKIWSSPQEIENERLRFEHVSDFLSVSEQEFFTRLIEERQVGGMVKNILDRKLLKRCLVLSDSYISGSGKHKIMKLSLEKNPDQLVNFRQLIWDGLPKANRTSIYDLWVDIPASPPLGRDADQCFIDEDTSKLHLLPEHFPYPRWIESYIERKWKGHIFYIEDDSHREAVNRAAKSMFRKLKIYFEPAATNECKL